MPENAAQKSVPRPASEVGEAHPIRRPPIVVVMGHVDHGKTTLLDYIRKANVAAKEAGGITQSIGAYEIIHHSGESRTNADKTQANAEMGRRKSASSQRESAPAEGRKITFIDTPGHEAFVKMRTRGASAADLAILVVAADEGVKPQTQESIRILKETQTPFVVAITKIDKSNADAEKVKHELTANDVLLEGYGGGTSYEPVSGKSGENVDKLLDLVLLAAEMENLTYDPTKPASGYILEARLDRRRGMEASVIVKDGALRQGEPIATPSGKGKIKILEDFRGEPAKTLEPSAPALIIGWEELPQVGEEFISGATETAATATAAQRKAVAAEPTSPASGEVLNLIFKAGDMGSLEALSQVILATFREKPVKVLQESVGDIGDNDVKLAISGNALIVAFKSRVDKSVKALAEANRVKIISSDVIYELIKAIEDFLKGGAEIEAAGELEILAVFNQKKPDKQVVGGKVIKGAFKNRALTEINRQGEVVGSGRVLNLQEQKKDVSQVGEGKEAGLLVSSQVLIQVGDHLVIKQQA